MAAGTNAQSVAGGCSKAAGETARDDGPGDDAGDAHSLSDTLETARAKVNLYLHVTGRRADGYHLLDSLAVFPPIADVVRATPAVGLSLSVDGPFAGGLTGDDNLVLRAARALAALPSFPRTRESRRHPRSQSVRVDDRFRRHGESQPTLPPIGISTGAHIRLTKNLPVASGIGGGSADAAAALRILCRIWAISPDPTELADLALSLGADVPACLRSQPVRMGGIGELLSPAPALPDCGIVLVNPQIPVPTAEVFRARQGGFSAPAVLPDGWPDAVTMAIDLRNLRNDLEGPAMTVCPEVVTVLSALRAQPGCLLARMSGSGATCFGLFADPVAAGRAAAGLGRSGWWSWGGRSDGTSAVQEVGR